MVGRMSLFGSFRMLQFMHTTKVICLASVLAVSACSSVTQSNPDIDEATAKSGRIAMTAALGLTAIGFTVAATRLD